MNQVRLYTPAQMGVAHRFSPRIQLLGDEVGLKISNYQYAAEHAARRIRETVGTWSVLEVCSGIGATSFVFAGHFRRLYAVDIDPIRMDICKQNLARLGLSGRFFPIVGDILDPDVLAELSVHRIRAVYTDANFSSTNDWRDHAVNITDTDPNTQLLHETLTAHFGPNICMKLPKTIDLDQVRSLGPCEIEELRPDNVLSAYLVYFGDLARCKFSQFVFPRQYGA